MKKLLYIVLCLMVSLSLIPLCSSCHYPQKDLASDSLHTKTRDSLRHLYERHYSWGTNLQVEADTIHIACLPVKNCFSTLRKGDHVVVAEFAIHPTDSVDSVWVKLAHNQEIQGWIRESEMKQAFVPTDSISQAIHLFSGTHTMYFLTIIALFVFGWIVRLLMKKQIKIIYFNDIDSVYPLLLCLLIASCATIYETMQVFAPDTWEQFYYNPTLSPLKVPFILSMFLTGLWLFIIVMPAVLDVSFRQLSPGMAIVYLLGVASCCIFCYFFFIFTTHFYIGYLFLATFIGLFIHKLRISLTDARYICGQCGQKLRKKGVCPHCGVMNE